MVFYSHTQSANLKLLVPLNYGWLPLVIITMWVWADEGALSASLPWLILAALSVSVFFLGFRTLRVSVTPTEVELAYALGWPRKRIPRADIESAESFRIPWWYGAGVRGTPKGVMWSVWGFDTVLLTLAGGRGFLIGTDDPDGLVTALR